MAKFLARTSPNGVASRRQLSTSYATSGRNMGLVIFGQLPRKVRFKITGL